MTDFINGSFAIVAGAMALLNLRCLYRDKTFSGASIWPPIFFNVWGVWSAYFYFELGQLASCVGGLITLSINTAWVAMAIRYGRSNEISSRASADLSSGVLR